MATGKGGLSALFEVDESRTHYHEPQRRLLQVTLEGVDHGPDTFAYRSREGGQHSLFNLDSDNGEIFVGPFLHKDAGSTWSFIVFAKPDGQWAPLIDNVVDARSARQTVLDIFEKFFPKDAPVVSRLQVIESDPYSWLTGAVTPTVRKAVGHTASGHVVAAIGDTAIAVDPVAGQGAANTLIQVAELVKAARARLADDPDAALDENWLTAEFEKHWERRGHAATEVTRLYLGDPDFATHLELAFPAAAVNTDIASALFGLLSDPNPLLSLNLATTCWASSPRWPASPPTMCWPGSHRPGSSVPLPSRRKPSPPERCHRWSLDHRGCVIRIQIPPSWPKNPDFRGRGSAGVESVFVCGAFDQRSSCAGAVRRRRRRFRQRGDRRFLTTAKRSTNGFVRQRL